MRVPLGLNILHFLNDGIRSTFVAMLPFVAAGLSLKLSSVGFLGSAQPLFACFLALPAGFLASKLKGFYLLTLLLLIYSAGALAASLAPNLQFMTLAFFMAALGFGMFHTVSFALLARISDKVGKDMGDFTAIGDIGRLTIPTTIIFTIPLLGWRMAFATIAAIGFITFILTWLFRSKKSLLDKQSIDNEAETHIDFIKNLVALLKTKKLLLTLFAAIMDSFASSPVFIFIPFILFAKGIPVTGYGFAVAFFTLGSLLGKSVLGRLVDKIGNLKVFILSEVFMAISLILLTIFSNFFEVILITFVIGVFTRGTTPVVQSMLSETADKIHYNKIYALSEMFIGIAAVITVIFMGFLAERIGIVSVFYMSAFLALIATFPAFLILSLRRAS